MKLKSLIISLPFILAGNSFAEPEFIYTDNNKRNHYHNNGFLYSVIKESNLMKDGRDDVLIYEHTVEPGESVDSICRDFEEIINDEYPETNFDREHFVEYNQINPCNLIYVGDYLTYPHHIEP